MNNRPSKYFIRWKIPIVSGTVKPTIYSEIKKGRGKIKQFTENSINITLYRQSIEFPIEIDSINPILASNAIIPCLINLCNLLQMKYFCNLGEAKIVKSNIPEDLIDLMNNNNDESPMKLDQEISYIYV